MTQPRLVAWRGRAAIGAAVILASALTAAGLRAQTPAATPGADLTGKTTAPSMGGVKDSVKDGLSGAAQSAGQAASQAAAGVAAQAAGALAGGGTDASGAPAGLNAQVPAADRIAALRRKPIREEDFSDAEELNRDPFKSYEDFLRGIGSKSVTATPDGPPAIFDTYALEELALIAIVSGDANPRAMFRDPKGWGATTKRGDYLSRNRARISKILSDRVVVELAEAAGPASGGKVVERAILLHPEENNTP